MVEQYEITLPEYERGFHLVTKTIRKSLKNLPEKGIINIMVKHVSAAICINENADPAVREDFNIFIDKLVPETGSYSHDLVNTDNMPAHIKSTIIGQSITIPITDHKLNMGSWQGIFFGEFKNKGESRKLVITVIS